MPYLCKGALAVAESAQAVAQREALLNLSLLKLPDSPGEENLAPRSNWQGSKKAE